MINYVNNDKAAYDSVVFAVRHLRRTLDSAAGKLAKENAEWHDDPEADDHADFHAPAETQYPRAVRDQAIRDLVRYYLAELKS